MFITRQHLPGIKAGQRQLSRIRLLTQKFVNLALIFFKKNRTSRVQQFTTLRQRRPQPAQDGGLLAGEIAQIGLAPQPFDVNMAPDNA